MADWGRRWAAKEQGTGKKEEVGIQTANFEGATQNSQRAKQLDSRIGSRMSKGEANLGRPDHPTGSIQIRRSSVMNLLTTVLWQAQFFLAQAGLPTGQEEDKEGWGGLIGIGVIILAVWVTMVLVRGLRREARERDEAELSRESERGSANSEVGIQNSQTVGRATAHASSK
jgi:hypothetical protein